MFIDFKNILRSHVVAEETKDLWVKVVFHPVYLPNRFTAIINTSLIREMGLLDLPKNYENNFFS